MAKKIFYAQESREKILSGAKQLYDAVKVTFGLSTLAARKLISVSKLALS